ncbi:putative histone chaperone asf-1 [Toxocara canis]|uniref:Putative histone chaperone asf-1 n=1 Tax=Toxocara canis TaxID=6265 RepID=A0A0B2VVK1_TOXCA|nr:putative histone chaperone asf-1 [Toxocara canis]
MGSRVNVCSVNVLDNPAKLNDPFKLEITFEAFEPLPDDLDWELVYVGSAESEKYDQVLDSVLVGPIVEGRHKFIFEADGPDPSKIPEDDIVGVTVLLLRCSYRKQLFIKVGWFVTLEYTDPEMKENPPATPILDQLQRTVCLDDVRVTTYPIKWDNAREEVLESDRAEAESSLVNDYGNKEQSSSQTNGVIPQQSPVDTQKPMETAFGIWLIQMLMLCLVPHYFFKVVLTLGTLIVSADLIYFIFLPKNLRIRFPSTDGVMSVLQFHLSTCFYVTLAADEPMEAIGEGQRVEGRECQDEGSRNALAGPPLVDVTNDPIPDLVD